MMTGYILIGMHEEASYGPALIEWAHEYDGYARLATGPGNLWRLLAPLHEEFEHTGEIPDWAGVDLLRGWAFYLVRSHRHSGGYGSLQEEHPEIIAIVDAIKRHPEATTSDHPESDRD